MVTVPPTNLNRTYSASPISVVNDIGVMSETGSEGQWIAQIMIMLTGLQISVLGVAFSDFLVLIGAGLTFSVVVNQIRS